MIAANSGERWIGRYLCALPVLWMIGIYIPVAALVLFYLNKLRWPKGVLITSVVTAWLSIAALQALSSFLNGVLANNVALGVHNMLGFSVAGWIAAALAIAVGYTYRLATPHIVRATTIVGGFVLLLGGVAAIVRTTGAEAFRFPTPVGLVLPDNVSAKFNAGFNLFAEFYHTEQTFDDQATRLTLFFPWAPLLGLGAVGITVISWLDRSLGWRLLGIAGGLVGTVFSWSRAAIISLLIVVTARTLLLIPFFWRWVLVACFLASLLLALLNGFDPLRSLADFETQVRDAREGSSSARDLINEGSFEGFLQSPMFGHGWTALLPGLPIELAMGGSSSFYGLLYTGGLTTFSAFVIAMVITLIAMISAVTRVPEGSEAHRYAVAGCLLMLTLILFCWSESLFSATLPCVFYFVFIGGVIAIDRKQEE